jgi:hypothetical protein
MQKKSPVSGRETTVTNAMDHVLEAEQAVRDAIRAGERRGAAVIAEANEQIRRIEQRAAERIRRAHDRCADAVGREARRADERGPADDDPAELDDDERERVRRAADRLAARLCGVHDDEWRGL